MKITKGRCRKVTGLFRFNQPQGWAGGGAYQSSSRWKYKVALPSPRKGKPLARKRTVGDITPDFFCLKAGGCKVGAGAARQAIGLKEIAHEKEVAPAPFAGEKITHSAALKFRHNVQAVASFGLAWVGTKPTRGTPRPPPWRGLFSAAGTGFALAAAMHRLRVLRGVSFAFFFTVVKRFRVRFQPLFVQRQPAFVGVIGGH